MTDTYILDETGSPQPCPDRMAWGLWFAKVGNRVVAKDYVNSDVEVSTMFLGLDHGFGEGEPVLFETMVFGGDLDQEQHRYRTLQEARAGHARMLAKVIASERKKRHLQAVP